MHRQVCYLCGMCLTGIRSADGRTDENSSESDSGANESTEGSSSQLEQAGAVSDSKLADILSRHRPRCHSFT